MSNLFQPWIVELAPNIPVSSLAISNLHSCVDESPGGGLFKFNGFAFWFWDHFQIINLFIWADLTKVRCADFCLWQSVTVLDNLCRRPSSCPRESPTELVSNKWSPGWWCQQPTAANSFFTALLSYKLALTPAGGTVSDSGQRRQKDISTRFCQLVLKWEGG